MLMLTAQVVAFATGVCTPSYSPASEFVAVDLVPDPDSMVLFDSQSPSTTDVPFSMATLVGNYTRGIDLDSPTSGYLMHTAQLFGTPTGLYRFQNGVTTLIAQLPALTESDCGFTLTPDNSTIYFSLGLARADDALYRCTVTGQFTQVGVIHRADGVSTDVIGLAMSDGGVLYGLDTSDDSLLSINPTTGSAVRVGSLGVPVGGDGELDFDAATGQLIMAADQITSQIFSVNTSTGAATYLGDLPFVTSAISFAGSVPVQCPMDLDNGSGTGTHDGAVTIDDLLYFIARFEDGSMSVDLDNGTGTGTGDGAVDVNDLLFFLANFENGC